MPKEPEERVPTYANGELDPTITGRGLCDKCGNVTANYQGGVWRHNWCRTGQTMNAWFNALKASL